MCFTNATVAMTDSSYDFRKRFGAAGLLVALSVLFLAACTAQYPLNPKVEKIDREAPYRLKACRQGP